MNVTGAFIQLDEQNYRMYVYSSRNEREEPKKVKSYYQDLSLNAQI